MTDAKNKENLKFAIRLKAAAENAEKLVALAGRVIAESHDKRTFSERRRQDLQVSSTGVNLGAAVARGRYLLDNNLSTNDKLYVIMNKYAALLRQNDQSVTKDAALERFCRDLAAKYPEAYGRQQIKRTLSVPEIVRIHGGRSA